MLKWSQMAPLAGIPPGVEPVRSRMLCGSDSFRDEGERRGERLSSLTKRQAG